MAKYRLVGGVKTCVLHEIPYKLLSGVQACQKCKQEARRRTNPTLLDALLTPRAWSFKQNQWKIKGIVNPPSREEYFYLLKNAGGICPLCGKPPGKRGFHLHHNQVTHEWVGLLCGRCNLGMGQFEDDPELLQRAANYAKHETWGSREDDYGYENITSLSEATSIPTRIDGKRIESVGRRQYFA
jgi:hypothetical protein